jgi:prefoldin alpha subunit
MDQGELVMKLGMYEQQIKQIQQQLQLVDQNIVELNALSEGLNSLKGAKDTEIMASIGKGIYVKAKLLSEDLIVDIGERNFVGKSIDEGKDLIATQIKRLGEAQEELGKALEEINGQLTETISSAEGLSGEEVEDKKEEK